MNHGKDWKNIEIRKKRIEETKILGRENEEAGKTMNRRVKKKLRGDKRKLQNVDKKMKKEKNE